MNFKDVKDFEKYREIFKLNKVVCFKNSLKQTVSKKMEIVFSVNFDNFTDVIISDNE